MNIIKARWFALAALLSLGAAQHVSAQHIGLMIEGGCCNNAEGNVSYFVSQNPAYTWESVSNATINAMSVAEMNSTFDIIIVPWTIPSSLNMDWATRLLPYLEAGGNVLWEDPANATDGDLDASGLSLSGGNGYSSSDISLVPPYDSNGAEGYYHIHYTIDGHNADWSPFSTDADGGVHGVVGQFGAGRMVLGVSDNLFHADFSLSETDATQDSYFQFFLNETRFVITGSVTGAPLGPTEPVPTLGIWALLALVLLLGFMGSSRLRTARSV